MNKIDGPNSKKNHEHESVNRNKLSAGSIGKDSINQTRRNTHGRFAPSAKKISLPVLVTDHQGKDMSYQYDWSELAEGLREVQDIRWSNDKELVSALTPKGTKMVGVKKRGVAFDFSRGNVSFSGHVVPMSPDRGQHRVKKIAVYTDDYEPKLNEKKQSQRVVGKDVIIRSGSKKKRKPSQNQVMKHPAKDELKRFLRENIDDLTPEAIAHLNHGKTGEWLHIIAYSLTNLKNNPQQRSNLGAARQQDNTRMMVVEKIPKHLSQYDDVTVDLHAKFSMLPNSEVIKDIAYEVVLQHGRAQLRVYQNTDVFSEYDQPRNTDQLIACVIEALLRGDACRVGKVGVCPIDEKENQCIDENMGLRVVDENQRRGNDRHRFFSAELAGDEQPRCDTRHAPC